MSIVGTFATREQASDAVDRLVAVGVPPDHISAIGPHGQPETLSETPGEQMGEVATGASVGALIGAVAGLAVSALVLPGIGMVLAAGPLLLSGALVGGLVGALARLGFSDEHAEDLAERLKAGRFLVVVHPDGHTAQAESELMNAGAEDVRVSDSSPARVAPAD